MTKGSDSREFFEIFKQTEKTEDVEKKEIKPQDVRPQTPTASVPESKPVTSPGGQSVDPLGWIKNTTRAEEQTFKGKVETPVTSQPVSAPPAKQERTPRKDEVTLRQETLIIGAIAATFLSIACFFVGYKVGYNKGTMNQAEEWLETIEPRDAKKSTFGQKTEEPPLAPQKAPSKSEQPLIIAKEKQTEQHKPIIRDKWTLRVVSYKNTKENLEKAKELAKTLQNSLGYDSFIVNVGKDLYICVGEFETNDSADLIDTQKKLAEFKYENKKQFDSCYPIRMR
ncbi:MAG: hypothetical protein HZA47_10285 [Planctomycetes bacterium]|uniref:hypothetical protein n=1 Tax=Candidatus Wunengus sp. YC65 TaxID=3367701 RepID=UPI001DE99ADD|nr:hypothetical protein [Planctomycetota bacterium]